MGIILDLPNMGLDYSVVMSRKFIKLDFEWEKKEDKDE